MRTCRSARSSAFRCTAAACGAGSLPPTSSPRPSACSRCARWCRPAHRPRSSTSRRGSRAAGPAPASPSSAPHLPPTTSPHPPFGRIGSALRSKPSKRSRRGSGWCGGRRWPTGAIWSRACARRKGRRSSASPTPGAPARSRPTSRACFRASPCCTPSCPTRPVPSHGRAPRPGTAWWSADASRRWRRCPTSARR